MVDQPIFVEKTEDNDKEKKKKRRNRRKQNSSLSACTSSNEICGERSECLGNGNGSNYVALSMSYPASKQNGFDGSSTSDNGVAKSSNVAFISLPTMHMNDQVEFAEVKSMQNSHRLPSEYDGGLLLKTYPWRNSYEEPVESYSNRTFHPSHQSEGTAQRKHFAPHWSSEVINEALEKGDAFRALFRVNAHNRVEAYCKIDGVPTDILINGVPPQNRAVEGDIVAIEVDPLSSWTRMKGLAGQSSNSPSIEDPNLVPEVNETFGDTCKGKTKVEADYENDHSHRTLLLEGELHHGKCASSGEGPIFASVNGHLSSTECMHGGSSSEQQNQVIDGVGKLCANITAFPWKRPTGRVVGIIERSPRRAAIVGFLGIKQWLYHREFNRKDTKKNKNSLSLSDREYVQLTPNDQKFPKMMVSIRGLPDYIKKRLEDGDATVEMELVAAEIDDWGEGSLFPQAQVIRVFGRGGEMNSHITAILFENAIRCYDFSLESLSCLPHVPWEVPIEELKTRRDLRNLCVFTIDPSTATDLDDALSVVNLSNGIVRVGVHIADVSHFVQPDSALDIEAQLRSTSVYMLQRKLPMLPPLFSENVCSLSPGVDRLSFSIFWDINIAGNVVDRWIGRTVIRSCCKLSYEHAQDIIDCQNGVDGYTSNKDRPELHGHFGWPDIVRSLKSLHDISKVLKENRFKDGALRLESSKLTFLFDEYGIPYDSMLCERKDSNFLVEEFMILANKTAAEVISRAFPESALLRRHPEPNMRRLRELEAFCSKHGLELDTTSSAQIHQSLERIKKQLTNDPVLFDILISYATKPMQLAAYFCSGDLNDFGNDWGHYALAVPLYTHFTSPLRRYPDIVVHRTLAAAVEAEEMYLKHKRTLQKVNKGKQTIRCFTGICFDKHEADSKEGRETLMAAALKHRIPSTEILVGVANYCNKRKLATRHVKDACDKLYMWALLRRKQILLSEARVLGLGPRFMSIYIQKLAIERRIYYDEVDGLSTEWLESTSTLVLNFGASKHPYRRGSLGKFRTLEDVALVISPCELDSEMGVMGNNAKECGAKQLGDAEIPTKDDASETEFDPPVFPLTLHILSTVPVALHAVGGDDGPLDVGVRLYMSSYFK